MFTILCDCSFNDNQSIKRKIKVSVAQLIAIVKVPSKGLTR